MANEFVARKGLIVSGSTTLTGSLTVTTGITGLLYGTASFATSASTAQTVTSASYAATASVLLGSVVSASFATTAATASSFSGSLQIVGLAEFGEGLIVTGGLYVDVTDTTEANKVLVLNTSTKQVFTTASISVTSASFATTSTSASFATTASFALNAGGGGGATFPFNGSAVITGSLLISGSGLRVTGSADILGNLTATTKSFKIPHQTQVGKNLVYGVLEGPEHAIYARGRLTNETTIQLPEEWNWLVDMDSVTIHLTPIGIHQKLYVKAMQGTTIMIGCDYIFPTKIDCFYTITGTRKDVPPLQTVE